ncbi:hypothetical protein [Borreliella bissettii]|uniref:Uncharacterized protein n=1 Tax=Borrelia bissettiae TaxID=64897 RepID=A0A1L8ZA16_BORBI|nr:hypothetical protein ER70_07885 [Borreliella bissettiae]
MQYLLFAFFTLVSSCKNYANLEQDIGKKVKEYLDKELMQGDYPNNSLLDPPPILLPNRLHHFY